MKTKEEILYKKWKQESLITVLDSSFVENVILPSMEEYAKAYHEENQPSAPREDKPATRYFNVSYVFNKNGLGYGNTNITATGDNGPYMEKLKVLEIISESSGAPVNSIVISNIIEMNESDYKQWIR